MNEGFLKIAYIYLVMEDSEYIKYITTYNSVLRCLESAYYICVKDGLEKIESLTNEKKMEIFSIAKKIKPMASKSEIISICRVIWLKQSV